MLVTGLALYLSNTLVGHDQLADDVKELGRLRAEFGDPYPEDRDRYFDDHQVEVFKQTSFGETEMFFPAGVADRRYYLSASDDSYTTMFLVLETKKGSKITVQWRAMLQWLPNGQDVKSELQKKKGTLELLLLRRGLRPWPPVDPRVWDRLHELKPLAHYEVDYVPGVLMAGFVHTDGTTFGPRTDIESDDVVSFANITPDNMMLPMTPFPYPVTLAEQAEMARLRAKGK